MTAKEQKIIDNLVTDKCYEFTNKNDITFVASYLHPDYDDEACFIISSHDGQMPAFHVENYKTPADLLAAMKKIAPLKEWYLIKS